MLKLPLRARLLAECYQLGEVAATAINTNGTTGVVCMTRLARLGDAIDRGNELEDILGPEARAAFDGGFDATILSEAEMKAACDELYGVTKSPGQSSPPSDLH